MIIVAGAVAAAAAITVILASVGAFFATVILWRTVNPAGANKFQCVSMRLAQIPY